jgi:hypothetical protein
MSKRQPNGLAAIRSCAVAMIVRFWRSGQEQRQQLKWFMYASVLAAERDALVAGELERAALSHLPPRHPSWR